MIVMCDIDGVINNLAEKVLEGDEDAKKKSIIKFKEDFKDLIMEENVDLEIADESQINTIFANFIAGSLFDKVEIVKSVEVDSVPQSFFEESLEFALENKNLIENHPAYFPLILSSIKIKFTLCTFACSRTIRLSLIRVSIAQSSHRRFSITFSYFLISSK